MYVFCVCYNKYNKKMQQCLRKLYKPKVIAFMTVCWQRFIFLNS